ncbi:MAG: hypothetical protein H6Q26_3375, partial [Bacteroidetes bacterium]|nr:hypothetical protein [Bacteroidota bacterium]
MKRGNLPTGMNPVFRKKRTNGPL